MTDNVRFRILAQLDVWDADHDTTACPDGPGCIHTAVDALRALVEQHSASTKRGREDICTGCDSIATFTYLDRCPTVGRIAEVMWPPTA